ncbi:MAG: phosphatase PAP2 family protein [Streptosporangiales bacterium]|nr:phosphatase PAP2 family protein [Streptosporangiales bacterium]MBO0890458.1 phosphatase PAP2 family protein [Acidothermales bacterium]
MFDNSVFLAVNAFARQTPWLHGFLLGYADEGFLSFAVLMVAGWWLARRAADVRRMAAALWTPIATLLAVAVNQPLVALFHEPRPFVAYHHILVLGHHGADPGFPSDHATMAGAAAAGLFLVSRRLGAFTAFAALLMAFARVYVADHYPRDVAAGLVLGAVVCLLGFLVLRRLLVRLVEWLAGTRVRPLVLCRRAYPVYVPQSSASSSSAPGSSAVADSSGSSSARIR